MLEGELTLKIDQIILWSDSTTVLTWLQSESCRFKVFVGTRVAEIQELTKPDAWRYVDSSLNPADDVTRGKTLAELALPNRWSQGPSFLLKGPDGWPSQPPKLPDSDSSEYRKSVSCGIVTNMAWPCSLQDTKLTWKDLVEAMVRELHGAAGQGSPVTASDYQQAEMMIYKRIQHDCFPEELHHLKGVKPIPNNSRLLTLSPELDPKEVIIRVGGRLRRAEALDPAFKHPIILDPTHPATKLQYRIMTLVSATLDLNGYMRKCAAPSGSCAGERRSVMYNIYVRSVEDGRLSHRFLRCQTYPWPVYVYISRPSIPRV